MAICTDMKVGDVYTCKNCGLELKVEKACSCSTESGKAESGGACTMPLKCCGKEMEKK